MPPRRTKLAAVEDALREQMRLAAFRAEVGEALARSETLPAVLQRCAEALVRHLDAAFARVWTLNERENVLELQASAGLYTHLDGPHGRVRVGEFKIGRIAQNHTPLLTNDVLHDPNIGDPAWARREGMVAFAGYPLMLEGRVVGVLALFARRALSETVTSDLASIGDGLAQWIQRKSAEESLRENRERLQASLDAAGAGTFRWNIQTDALEWDANLDALFGLAPERTIRSLENFIAAVHPDDRAGVIARCEQCAQEGVDLDMEFRVVWPDGSIHWLDDKGRTFFDAQRRPQYMTGACVDITARKLSEASVRESEERFRALADNIPQLAWMADAEGWIFWYNQRWFDYTGLTLAEMQGWGWDRVQHPEHLSRVVATWQQHLQAGTAFEATFPLRGSDGQFRWFLTRATPIRDAQGKVLRWFGTNTDVTAQRETTEALEAAKASAEAASRAKDDFLAALSHELRTPLTPVLMLAAALENDPSVSAELRPHFAMMRRNIELEARLIDDLLDLTRVSRDKLQLHRVIADVHQLLAHTEEIVRSEVRGKQLETKFTLEAAGHHVKADPARLQQVFWNLLKNAYKFTDSGGQIRVRTSNDRDGRLVITVADTGMGIDAAVMPHIFRAFDQGELAGRDHRFGGLGLGLAISKAIVDLHGGEIRVASPGRGQGATFTVELATVPAPAAGELPGVISAAPVRPLRLLLVEDHEATLSVLARLFERAGHRIATATTVREALDAAAAQSFDAVISDLGLPDASGLDLMREIALRYGWPGIALSGYGMEHDLQQTRDAGFFAHLVKPVNFEQLRQLLVQLPPRATRAIGAA